MKKLITSASNPMIKQLRALATSKKARQESDTFILEGWRGLETLLTHNSRHYKLETLVTTESQENDSRLPDSIDTIILPEFIFEKISAVQHAQGILCVVRHTPAPFEFNQDAGRYLLLDSISDPGNLGTLIRSAVGAGYDGLFLFGDCVEPFNPKVIRSTMGTFPFCPVWAISYADIEKMQQTGYEVCITCGHGGEDLYAARFSQKTIMAIGSEAHGVSAELMQLADKKISIPLNTACESLNAAIAGSICMFQTTRQNSLN